MEKVDINIELEGVSQCPACYSDEARPIGYPLVPLYQVFLSGYIPIAHTPLGNRRLLECKRCGLRYFEAVPTFNSLSAIYNMSSIGHDCSDNLKRGKQLYDKLYSVGLPFREDEVISVLDIGCNTGEFIRVLPRIWNKAGVDINSRAINFASRKLSNVKFYTGAFEDIDFPAESFDLITAWDVVEHVRDVRLFLDKVRFVLKPSGFFVFETGNFSSVFARFAGLTWYYYSLIEHMVFYDAKVIRCLLPRYGLEVINLIPSVHHLRRGKKKYQLRLVSFLLVVSTLRGKVTDHYYWLLQAMKKNGTLPQPDVRDHMVVGARKLESDRGL